MKVEIKSVKYYASFSEETNCFQANIYLNGKKAGRAENRGHGGETVIWIDDPKLRVAFAQYVASLPEQDLDLGDGRIVKFQPQEASVIDDLLEAYLVAKDQQKVDKQLQRIKAKNQAKGMKTAVLTINQNTLWIGFPQKFSVDEAVQKYQTQKQVQVQSYREI